jgi:ABC-type sugar transport system substrate-binding protein
VGLKSSIAWSYLNDAFRAGKPYDVIYVTTAGMTIGCMQPISELCQLHDGWRPALITYDGTEDTERLARRGEISGTVVQDAKLLAHAAAEQLRMLWQRKPLRNRIVTLSPVYKPARR